MAKSLDTNCRANYCRLNYFINNKQKCMLISHLNIKLSGTKLHTLGKTTHRNTMQSASELQICKERIRYLNSILDAGKDFARRIQYLTLDTAATSVPISNIGDVITAYDRQCIRLLQEHTARMFGKDATEKEKQEFNHMLRYCGLEELI